MDFGFEVISAQEYERQRALYGPLTESLRKLIDAGLRTDAHGTTVEAEGVFIQPTWARDVG
jgi:hypothetical protein